jgi:capreomycidine synthase
MKLPPFLLENWLREYYFNAKIDIGSSGVENFSIADLREILGFRPEDLDRIVFQDSSALGEHKLRKVIAQRWGNGDPNRVIVTHGSSEAIYLIMNTLLQAGDEVVVLVPSYQALFSIAESIGCQLKPWQLRYERQFAPDIEEAKSLISARTRMVIVNFPNNPTGALLSVEEQKDLINSVARIGAYIVWDAAFAELTYNSSPLPDPGLQYDRAISIGTLSKAYGLPGLRVGWCLASPDLLANFVKLRDYITLSLSPLVEFIAQQVVEKADLLLNIRLQQARVNLNILAEWVNQHQEVVRWVPPKGGVCALLQLCKISDVEAFCHNLAYSHGVLLVPGTCFNYPTYVRLGFGGATPYLKQGLSYLSNSLNINLTKAQ